MKNDQKVLGCFITFLLVAFQAYAAMEAPIEPVKTFSDFQSQYSATKPTVAWTKYQEYQQFKNAPRPTLTESRIRTEPVIYDEFAATKPTVRAMHSNEPKVKTVDTYVPFDPYSGTKPIARFLNMQKGS